MKIFATAKINNFFSLFSLLSSLSKRSRSVSPRYLEGHAVKKSLAFKKIGNCFSCLIGSVVIKAEMGKHYLLHTVLHKPRNKGCAVSI